MKVKVSHLLAAFITIFLAIAAQAQEELPLLEVQDHRELNLDEDKTLIYDHSNHATTVRDSIQSTPRIVPATSMKTAKPDAHRSLKEKEEADALNFNFLYYMIQKFKMSDLIDQ